MAPPETPRRDVRLSAAFAISHLGSLTAGWDSLTAGANANGALHVRYGSDAIRAGQVRPSYRGSSVDPHTADPRGRQEILR